MPDATVINVQLLPSQERELIAQFVDYAFEHSWVVQDTLDAIRNGSYLRYVIPQKIEASIETCPNCHLAPGVHYSNCPIGG